MMIFRISAAALFLVAASTMALPVHNFTPTAAQCAAINDKINQTTSRLRSEHSIREGAYLKQQLQDLRDMRSACQRAGLKTYSGG